MNGWGSAEQGLQYGMGAVDGAIDGVTSEQIANVPTNLPPIERFVTQGCAQGNGDAQLKCFTVLYAAPNAPVELAPSMTWFAPRPTHQHSARLDARHIRYVAV